MGAVDVYNVEGGVVGSAELPPVIFGVENPSQDAIYFTVKAYLINQRQGNADTLTRAEVDRTKKKLWRQKGTGRARMGTMGSPVWVGGGAAHGPHPRPYDERVPKKVRRLALRSALTLKARDNQVRVLEDVSFDAPKTRRVADMARALGVQGRKALLVVGAADPNLFKSCRNLPGFDVRPVNSFSVYDVMGAETVMFTRSALARLSEVWGAS
ncbi:50S ribosomal protein L4 [bacterium]|nr:50S ribosomal protein L4 [bacterium]